MEFRQGQTVEIKLVTQAATTYEERTVERVDEDGVHVEGLSDPFNPETGRYTGYEAFGHKYLQLS